MANRLSNTNYFIQSGTWRVNEDATTGERYIECVVAGIISRRNLDAYGTWEFETKHTALGVSVAFIADSVQAVASGSGYSLDILANGIARLRQNTPGDSLAVTAAGYIQTGTRTLWRITRSELGVFSVYHQNPIGSSWALLSPVASGSNPVTDLTFVASLYQVAELYAGDRIYLDNQLSGVVPPV